MDFIYFNGKLVAADTPIADAGNRGLRYGDGLFETIQYRHHTFQLLEQHLERFWAGLHQLQFELPALFTQQWLAGELLQLVHKNKHTHARVRLMATRASGGLYDARHHRPDIIIQSWQLAEEAGRWNSNGLQLCIYKDAVKPCDAFSNLKHNNFLPYLMGALFAKENRCNDAIILNQHGRVADTTIANIFIIKNGIIYTPALQEGCIAGTRRQFLLNHLPALGFTAKETTLTEQDIAQADEIFVSNAMAPIKWVAAIGPVYYTHTHTLAIYNRMRTTFPGIFC